MDRRDEPHVAMSHAGAFDGGRALIVLGGPSGASWKIVRDSVKPDVLITVNGVASKIPDADYWICSENMNWAFAQSTRDGTKLQDRAMALMKMFRGGSARVRLVNRLSHHLLSDSRDTIKIKRSHIDSRMLPHFDFGSYDQTELYKRFGKNGEGSYWQGLMNGPRMQRPEIIKDIRLGTVALQALHWAGILGCSRVDTTGMDFCFPTDKHHWYTYPSYVADGRFWLHDPIAYYKGIKTHWFWVDSAEFLLEVEPIMEQQGLIWRDHSSGLLKAMGLKCAS